MLIVNADDWGRSLQATNNTLTCHKEGRITSVSAMMFMEDSERSAELASKNMIETGLHLNFTTPFSASNVPAKLAGCQLSTNRFLRRNKYSFLFFNPFLRKQFSYLTESQFDEYRRLYGHSPSHVDGHHHMHLCTNVVMDRLIPKGSLVRRNFSFERGEKSLLNRLYRYLVDVWLVRKYVCVDYFFALPVDQPSVLRKIVALAESSAVELMTHPEESDDYSYLLSKEYLQIISGVERARHASAE